LFESARCQLTVHVRADATVMSGAKMLTLSARLSLASSG
jgi:hypothetical protein